MGAQFSIHEQGPLLRACEQGDYLVITNAIEQQGRKICKHSLDGPEGNTIIHVLARNGHADGLEAVIGAVLSRSKKK